MNAILRAEKGRVLSNYARLFGSLLIGLLVTRLLLGAGDALFGIYTTITIGMGISVMLTELLRLGFVPELGPHVFDGKVVDTKEFGDSLAAAFTIAIGAAAIGLMIMLLLGLWLLPNEGAPELERAAWIFLWARIAMMVVVVTLTPAMSILIVSGRQPVFNLFLFFERLSELIGVAVPIWLLTGLPTSEAARLVQIGLGVAVLTSATYVLGAAFVFALGPEYRAPRHIPPPAKFISILKRIGWSGLQTIAMNLYVRADMLIVAAFSGPLGVVALGVALRLMGYVRQATMGLVSGLDAAFANNTGRRRRNTQTGDDDDAIDRRLIETSTALQGSVVFQLVVLFMLFGTELVDLWLGDVLTGNDSGSSLNQIVTLSSLMVIGISFRSLNLGWMAAMSGQGNARHFAPWLLPGAVINVIVLTGWALFSPQNFSVIVVGWVFVVLQVLTHGLLIPIVSARSLGIGLGNLFKPFVVPFMVALATYALGYGWEVVSAGWSALLHVGGLVTLIVAGFLIGLVNTFRRAGAE